MREVEDCGREKAYGLGKEKRENCVFYESWTTNLLYIVGGLVGIKLIPVLAVQGTRVTPYFY